MADKKSIKSNNGITLIALVVTIIIILILASVTLAQITGDDGLLNKTREFSENTNTITNDSNEEINSMSDELDEIMNPWVQNKTVVTKKMKSGTKTYNVGDDYTYDCGVSEYTTAGGKWKVLGAERGKLLIMSTVDVGTLQLSGKDGYNTGVSKLNTMCAQYGTNARSIKVEDINRVTGYAPTNQGDGKVFGAGKFYEYGNKVTYTASGSTATNGKTNTTLAISKYEHPDGRKIGTDNVTSITVESTGYYYYPYSLTASSSTTGECKGIATDSSAYKLLFRNADDSANCSYWLASSLVGAYSNISYFGLRNVLSGGRVSGYILWDSGGNTDNPSLGVRAVVPVE